MHKRFLLTIFIVGLLLPALHAPAALAHEGPPRIELNTAQTTSGAEIEVRGVNVAPEQPVTLSLVGDGIEYALGTVVGDVHGDFVVGVRLPGEAVAGAYTVRAFGANRVIVGAALALLGTAAEEGGEQRGADEPLLAPMPSPLPATAAPPRPAAVVAPAQALTPAAPARPFPVWLFAALAAVMLAVGVLLAMRRRTAM
jgi:hypothetical protein